MARVIQVRRRKLDPGDEASLRGTLKPSRFIGWGRALGIIGWALWVLLLNLRSVVSGKGLSPAATMKWHKGVTKIAGMDVTVHGTPIVDRPVLILSNHASYLDIIVLASILPCNFVAKAEVAGWPIFGWMAKLQRTVFVERERKRAAEQLEEMKRRLNDGACLVLFPEGTSSDGSRVLPFKSSLLQAAEIGLDDGRQIEVQTVSIGYSKLDGMPMGRALRPFYTWYGDMDLAPHLIDALGVGTVGIDVIFHDPVRLEDLGNRKALAKHAFDACSQGVEAALNGRAVS